MATGTSWRRSGERKVSPWIRTSGTGEILVGSDASLAVGAVCLRGEASAGLRALLARCVHRAEDRAEAVEAVRPVGSRNRLAELPPAKVGRVVVQDVARGAEEAFALAVRARHAADGEDPRGLLAGRA